MCSSSTGGQGVHRRRTRSRTAKLNSVPTTENPAGSIAYGHAWWLDDAKERSQDRTAGKVRSHLFFCAMGLLFLSIICWTSHTGALTWTSTNSEVAASPRVPPRALAYYRLAAAVFVWGSSLHQITQKWEVMIFENLDRSRDVHYWHGGIWRWQGLTFWSWALVGAYFSVSASISFSVLASPADPAHSESSVAACIAVMLLGSATGYALLVTVIVTFVLIPTKAARGRNTDAFFSLHGLLQHNANIALMAVELLGSGMHVDICHLPFAVLFGLVYIFFHQVIRWHITHTMLYFFLTWQGPHALKVYTALCAALSLFFVFGWLIAETLRPKPWGPPLVLLLALAIMRVRQPPSKPQP